MRIGVDATCWHNRRGYGRHARALLRALVRNRGRLMTHRKLLVEVWGPEYVDDIQPLRTHIARLRAKIEPEGAAGPRYIVTDPGVGYRFSL